MDIYSLTNTSCHLAQMLCQIHGERISAHAPGQSEVYTTPSQHKMGVQTGTRPSPQTAIDYDGIGTEPERVFIIVWEYYSCLLNLIREKMGLPIHFFGTQFLLYFARMLVLDRPFPCCSLFHPFSPLLFTRTNPCVQLWILSQYSTHCRPPLRKHFPQEMTFFWLSRCLTSLLPDF